MTSKTGKQDYLGIQIDYDLEDRLELVGNNLVKMHQIEQEIFEIEDTIAKLTA